VYSILREFFIGAPRPPRWLAAYGRVKENHTAIILRQLNGVRRSQGPFDNMPRERQSRRRTEYLLSIGRQALRNRIPKLVRSKSQDVPLSASSVRLRFIFPTSTDITAAVAKPSIFSARLSSESM
jgi:hypothetical protein